MNEEEDRIGQGPIQTLGGRLSLSLGIDLGRKDQGEIFEWFLGSIRFGATIEIEEADKFGLLRPAQEVLGAWEVISSDGMALQATSFLFHHGDGQVAEASEARKTTLEGFKGR